MKHSVFKESQHIIKSKKIWLYIIVFFEVLDSQEFHVYHLLIFGNFSRFKLLIMPPTFKAKCNVATIVVFDYNFHKISIWPSSYSFFFSASCSAASSRKSSKQEPDDALTSEECPEPNGYFADAEQCDKYYQCVDGAITEKLCPDGMVFNDYSTEYEKCDLPFNIDCSARPKLRKSVKHFN